MKKLCIAKNCDPFHLPTHNHTHTITYAHLQYTHIILLNFTKYFNHPTHFIPFVGHLKVKLNAFSFDLGFHLGMLQGSRSPHVFLICLNCGHKVF